MTEERVMDSVSGSIWGPSGPSRKAVFTLNEEADMLEGRLAERKETHLTKIMGELESFLETPGEEWGSEHEDALIDMLNAIEHTVKAQISSNDPRYEG